MKQRRQAIYAKYFAAEKNINKTIQQANYLIYQPYLATLEIMEQMEFIRNELFKIAGFLKFLNIRLKQITPPTFFNSDQVNITNKLKEVLSVCLHSTILLANYFIKISYTSQNASKEFLFKGLKYFDAAEDAILQYKDQDQIEKLIELHCSVSAEHQYLLRLQSRLLIVYFVNKANDFEVEYYIEYHNADQKTKENFIKSIESKLKVLMLFNQQKPTKSIEPAIQIYQQCLYRIKADMKKELHSAFIAEKDTLCYKRKDFPALRLAMCFFNEKNLERSKSVDSFFQDYQNRANI